MSKEIFKGFSTYRRSKMFRVVDFELVKQDIFNHFSIRRGEKLMRPDFGTQIWDYLFEPFDQALVEAVQEECKVICESDPRVRVQNVRVDVYDQGLSIQISLVFKPLNLVDELYLKFDRDNQLLVRE
jgi:phage baseplate assembly protein W